MNLDFLKMDLHVAKIWDSDVGIIILFENHNTQKLEWAALP